MFQWNPASNFTVVEKYGTFWPRKTIDDVTMKSQLELFKSFPLEMLKQNLLSSIFVQNLQLKRGAFCVAPWVVDVLKSL